jgi:homoserine kinase
MLGGIVLIRSYHPLELVSLPVPRALTVVVVHPDVEVLTRDSRAVLPKKISLNDGITQWSNTAALVAGLFSSDYGLIGSAIKDVVAEPVRSRLIPCFDEVKQAALMQEALGCSISGSGPSVFALCAGRKHAGAVARAMQRSFRSGKIKSVAYISKVNTKGVMKVRQK